MPLTGGTDPGKLVIGPGVLYLGSAIPADGSLLSSILTSGVPADGFRIGYTKEGTELHYSFEPQFYDADEAPKILTQATQESAKITGTALQLANITFLTALLPNATAASAHMKLGGKSGALVSQSVLVVGSNTATPSKIVAIQLYNCVNVAEFILKVSGQGPSETPFEFEGQSVGARAAGDTLGQIWIEP